MWLFCVQDYHSYLYVCRLARWWMFPWCWGQQWHQRTCLNPPIFKVKWSDGMREWLRVISFSFSRFETFCVKFRLLHILTSIYFQVIGNNNLIMGSCHIAHDCKIGNNNIFANNTLLAGHVVVEVSPLFILLGLTSLYNVISQIFYLIRI